MWKKDELTSIYIFWKKLKAFYPLEEKETPRFDLRNDDIRKKKECEEKPIMKSAVKCRAIYVRGRIKGCLKPMSKENKASG